MFSVVRANTWICLKLPSGHSKVLQAVPNKTISLGKYGSFASNLILERPYHLTYEVLDKRSDEEYSRLRIVPASELHAQVFAEEAAAATSESADDSDRIRPATDGVEYTLVDGNSGEVVARSDLETLGENGRQTLSMEQIEELKRDGAGAGKDLITKLLLSHTALDQKTSFSLSKYKLMKAKKYIRRFQVLPLDMSTFQNWQIEKDSMRILDMREEMLGLVGCWANVHFGGEEQFLPPSAATSEDGEEAIPKLQQELLRGRWMVVDDTCGFLVGAMAERMGILTPADHVEDDCGGQGEDIAMEPLLPTEQPLEGDEPTTNGLDETPARETNAQRRSRPPDLQVPFSQSNTLTVIHSSPQVNLSFLNYFGFDYTDPDPPPHPLVNHLMTVSWLQLLKPELDMTLSASLPTATSEEMASWKTGRRGVFHRKRRRYTRIRHAVDAAQAGQFSGLVCASFMEPVSILRHTLPLLAGGAPVAIYSPTIDSLAELADCFSIGRRTEWLSNPPTEAVGKTVEELHNWGGSKDFPLNPTLLIGVAIHTSRTRPWQVLPGRTHPLMTTRGGEEGYVFTAWRARPAEGKIAARGNFTNKKRRLDASNTGSETPGTPAEARM